MAPPHILNWLKQAVANYVYQQETTAAISSALDAYSSLKIKTDQYTFDDGRTLLLLCLHGTLPITYASARYNVPVAIWLPLDSPRSPPMVYVVPTSGMLVRKGRGVELDGRVNEDEWEYLKGWRRKWEAHSMLPLLQSLVDAFSQYPPVYAKPAAAPPPLAAQPSRAPQSPTPAPPQPQPPRPPHPIQTGQDHLPQYTRPSASPSTGQPPAPPPPPPPPLPPIPGQSPVPAQAHTRQPSLGSVQGFPRSNSQSSFGRPHSLQHQDATSPLHSHTYSSGYAPHPPAHYASPVPQASSPHPSVQQQQPPPLPPQQPIHPAYQGHPLYAQRSTTLPSQPTGPLPTHSQGPLRAAPQPPASPARLVSQPPPARQPVLDLLSGDDDASASPGGASPAASQQLPPPPPPNPETLLLHSTLHSTLSSSLAATLDSLTTRRAQLVQIKGDLASAQPAIEDEMARLRAVRDVCRGVGERLGGVVSAGDERLKWLEARGDVSVDEVVCSTTIVYNQLIDLVAEDAAISDTIYQLNRALNAERIDLERFLKMTRILARDQFRCRALVEKILRG